MIYHVHGFGKGCPLGPSRDPFGRDPATPSAFGASEAPQADLPTQPTRGGTILGTFHHSASAHPAGWPAVPVAVAAAVAVA